MELRELLELQQIDFKRRNPKIPTDEQFGRLVLGTRGKVQQLGSRLARGILEPQEYIEALFDLLESAHAQAVLMGRNLGGDLTPFESDDEAFAKLIMDGEARFLARFEADILTGRYGIGKEVNVAAINARANLYTGKLRATANETFVLSSEVTDTFAWELLAAENCDDCPRIANGGPYTASQLDLIGYPGNGRQQCRTNCGCILVRLRDKVFGFSRSYL